MDLSQLKDMNPDVMKNLDEINKSLSPEQQQLFDTINDGIDYINENKHLFGCDEKCMKEKEEKELYNSFINAKISLNNAPKNLTDAERKFITYKDGGMKYQQIIEKRNTQEGINNSMLIEKEFMDKYNEMDKYINMYSDQEIYYNNVDDLTNKYKQDINNIEKKNTNLENENNVSNRKLFYDYKWIDTYKTINLYLKRIFWVTFILFSFLSIYYKKYSNKLFKLGFPLLLLFGIIPSKWFVLNIKNIVVYIYSKIKIII